MLKTDSITTKRWPSPVSAARRRSSAPGSACGATTRRARDSRSPSIRLAWLSASE